MKSNCTKIASAILFLLFMISLPVLTKEDKGKKVKQPKIHVEEKAKERPARGSKEEIEEFKKRKLPLPIDIEEQETQEMVAPRQEPSEEEIKPKKIRKDENLRKSPPQPKTPKQKKISKPEKFRVKYNLKNAAEVAVNILDSNYFPIRTFIISGADIPKNVKLGAKKGTNEFPLWDGKDMYGNEVPAGEYYACLSIVYQNGRHETIGFKFVKE